MKIKIFQLLMLITSIGCTDMSSIKNKYVEVNYANISDAQKLDVFIPEGSGPFPAVILIHGGGFKAGDKKAEYSLAKKLVSNGYVAICVNYRLSGEATFPAAVHDIKAAIRYIRGNAKKYTINPHKIGTWGSSAGGNLSAMMGTSSGNKFIDGDIGDHQNESTKIQVCVDWFGPIELTKMVDDAQQLGFKENFRVALESKYLGADATNPNNFDLAQMANPTSYIDINDTPFYVQVGDKDPLVPYLQSQNFANALRTVLGNDKVSFDLIKGGKHGGKKFSNTKNLNKVIAFLDKHLK